MSTALLPSQQVSSFNQVLMIKQIVHSNPIRASWPLFSFKPAHEIWYLSHRWPAKAQASLHIRPVSPEPSLLAYMKYGSRWKVRSKIRHLAPLDGCTCTFENEFTEDEKCYILISWLIFVSWQQLDTSFLYRALRTFWTSTVVWFADADTCREKGQKKKSIMMMMGIGPCTVG